MLKKILSNQFLRFCFVGGLSTIINYSVFYLLLVSGIHYLISSAIGYLTGVLVGFTLNKKFTFRSESKQYSIEITKYLFVYTASLFLGLGLLRLLVSFGLSALLANVCSIGLTTITNFLGSKFFVFKGYMQKIDFIIYRYKYLIRYIIIGLASLLVEILIIEILAKQTPVGISRSFYYLNIIIGFLSGVFISFLLNSRLNFPVKKHRNLRTFRIFLVISIFSFILNLLLMKFVFAKFFDYRVMRFITAAIIFLVSYTLHRRFTFTFIRDVGIAVYLKKSEDINKIKSRILNFPDFIHIDLVDKTYKKDAEEVDLSKIRLLEENWPFTKKMVHIMSKKPSKWIDQLHNHVDYIIFHTDTDEEVLSLITKCRSYSRKPGICLSYLTPVESVIKYLDKVDMVQVLGIKNPGESGQNLQPLALEKLSVLNDLKKKYSFEICFDGGVKFSNINKINARYLVSGSTVLNAADPKKAIYDLKTSSKYYLKKDTDLKSYLQKEIGIISSSLDFIKSLTLVGSFPESASLDSISDIDIVIIIDELSKSKFQKIISAFRKLEQVIKTDYDYDLVLNTTFGPLKFYQDNTVVLHLMVYDTAGHILHCKESPFTCLDWQLSKVFFKSPMASIAQVTHLQPNYFFNSRRSVNDYLSDLNKGAISYREYLFSSGKPREVKKYKVMEDKDRFEFAYHIMKFSMSNFLKMYHKENGHYPINALIQSFFKVFPLNKDPHINYFARLNKIKKQKEKQAWSKIDMASLTGFLSDFETQASQYASSEATRVYFVRHGKIKLNQPGIFIGQRVDPDILPLDKPQTGSLLALIKDKGISAIYSSPLKRCIQTARITSKGLSVENIVLNDSLKEIDYGLLDGKTIDDLNMQYPELTAAWKNKQDPRFPKGENSQDVVNRVNNFLGAITYQPGQAYLACTHNVFLRCLIGSQSNTPMHKWFLLTIPHLEPIEVILTRDRKIYLNLTPAQQKEVFKNL